MGADVDGLLYSTAFLGALSALGLAVDNLLLPSQMKALRRALEDWWCMVGDLRVPDLPRAMARASVTGMRSVFGAPGLSARFVLSTAATSGLLTTAALYAGESKLGYFSFAVTMEYLPRRRLGVMYPINYVLDFATLAITAKCLDLIAREGASRRTVFLVLVDVATALGLAVACFGIADYVNWDVPWDAFAYFRHTRSMLVNFDGTYSADVQSVLYASTTFLPTVAYFCVLVALAVSLLLVRIGRAVSMHVLQLSIETDRTVFFYTATLIGALGLVGKLLLESIHLVGWMRS